MTDKELKRLSRAELLELLINQMKENEVLRTRLAGAEARLDSRMLEIEDAGTMAEAAMRLNAVFASADAAAKQYLDIIKCRAGLLERPTGPAAELEGDKNEKKVQPFYRQSARPFPIGGGAEEGEL